MAMVQRSQQPNPAEAYERVVAQGMFVPWTQDLLARAAPKPGETVLDLACGTGMVMRSLVSMVGATGRVVGLDISPPMLEVARAKVPTGAATVEFHEGSGTELPFEDGTFGLVTCQQGLQFFPDHAKGLSEIRRVLAAGGRAVISVWRELQLQPLLLAIDGVVSRHIGPGALAVGAALGDADLLRKLATGAGFSRVDIEQVEMRIRVAGPEMFVPMMIQAAAAVLPAFAKLAQEDRQALVGRMRAEIDEALEPLMDNNQLIHDTAANVLTVSR
ncbi:MAG: class I SAM-dependent methyltransferase [Gemmatimonadota bacterium]